MASKPTLGHTELDQIERGHPFIVRREPKPVPVPLIDAAPAACAKINLQWLPHILGAIEALNARDAWQGTENEIYTAQQQIEILANQLKAECDTIGDNMQFRQTDCLLEVSTDGITWSVIFDGNCNSPAQAQQFRQTDCQLEVSDDGGATWTPVFDASCATPAPLSFNQVDCTLQVNGSTIFDASCATPTGDEGLPVETAGDNGIAKRCDFATYMVDIPLPSMLQELITIKETAQANQDILNGLWNMFAIVAAGAVALTTAPAWAVVAFGAAVTGVGEGIGIANAVAALDTIATNGEATPQFWQDVKCQIYCVMEGTGKLTRKLAYQIAGAIEDNLTTAYPNAAPIVAEMFYAFSEEARAVFTVYASEYDGSNCDICACTEWSWDVARAITATNTHTTYLDLVKGQFTFDAFLGWVFLMNGDSGNPNRERLEVIVDISDTAGELTRFRTPTSFRQAPGGVSGALIRLDIYSPVDGTEINVYNETDYSLGRIDVFFPFAVTRLKFTFDDWTFSNTDGAVPEMILHGSGRNPFEEELGEDGTISAS